MNYTRFEKDNNTLLRALSKVCGIEVKKNEARLKTKKRRYPLSRGSRKIYREVSLYGKDIHQAIRP